METYKDILCRQIDTLQQYFDICAENAENHHDPKGKEIYILVLLFLNEVIMKPKFLFLNVGEHASSVKHHITPKLN